MAIMTPTGLLVSKAERERAECVREWWEENATPEMREEMERLKTLEGDELLRALGLEPRKAGGKGKKGGPPSRKPRTRGRRKVEADDLDWQIDE